MKPARHEVHRRASKIPEIQFEEQKLTSFSGLVIFQKLFQNLDLREKLRCCFAHVKSSAIFKYHEIVLALVVHLLLGYRRLRDIIYYQYDPLVLRLLSLRVMPTVATVSRALATADEACVAKLRALFQHLCLEVLKQLNLRRITLDFDGSVLGTKRAAEGAAVGYNKKKKGSRSYYPLFCTIPQTGQVFDFLYRSGNVHDSNGAKEFILDCIAAVSQALPGIQIEIRMDSAFFSDEIVSALEDHKGGRISFTISVPFERFGELKSLRRQHALYTANTPHDCEQHKTEERIDGMSPILRVQGIQKWVNTDLSKVVEKRLYARVCNGKSRGSTHRKTYRARNPSCPSSFSCLPLAAMLSKILGGAAPRDIIYFQ